MAEVGKAKAKGAWVTVVTSLGYCLGALVLNSALRRHRTAYPLVCLVNPALDVNSADEDEPRLPEWAREALRRAGCTVREVDFLMAGGKAYEGPEARFADTWVKLRALELFEYERVVLLDADMLPRRNMDELFELDLPRDWIAASHACTCNPRKIPTYPADWVPANCAFTYYQPASSGLSTAKQPTPEERKTFHSLNSGLVIITPDPSTSRRILDVVANDPTVPDLPFPDQDLLAREFRGRVRFLPYEYNALKTLRSCHQKIWDDEKVKNVHYILKDKPWTGRPRGDEEFAEPHRWWWAEFDAVEPALADVPAWERLKASAIAS